MGWILRFLNSSIGSKVLMAVTGAGLLGFVIAHMAGNMLVFAGPEALNEYAHGLQSLGAVLWGARLGLLGCLLVHVIVAFKLWMANRNARPSKYQYEATLRAPVTSRTMIVTGASLLAFIVYHLLHFTVGVVGSDHHASKFMVDVPGVVGEQMPDVYQMVVTGFSSPAVAITYIVAMLLLGGHLHHGIASLFQTLGLAAPKYRPLIQKGSMGLAAVLVLGNIAMPLSIMLGIISLKS